MRFPWHWLPDGWPVSMWFLIATFLLLALQRFPLTGIFLMMLAAPLWSVILVNLGMVGIAGEAAVGRVSRGWLLLPMLYFGAYYAAYLVERVTLQQVRADYVSNNAGASLDFDRARQQLLVVHGKGDIHPGAFEYVRKFGLERAFDATGKVWMVGDKEACDLVRNDRVMRSANVFAGGFYTGTEGRKLVKGQCSIYAPGEPDLPTVRVLSDQEQVRRGILPILETRFRLIDDTSGEEVELVTGRSARLKPFPMPVMGCGLNSGNPSWDCGASFLRNRKNVLDPKEDYIRGDELVAAALGLEPLEPTAVGVDVVRAYADKADRELVAEEVAILQEMLADPLVPRKSAYLRHLLSRPDVVAPYADELFEGLEALQRSDREHSAQGETFWSMAALLSDDLLAPHRAKMIDWMQPGAMRNWTDRSNAIFTRLDGAIPEEREILLTRLEQGRGDLKTSLLPTFCAMGSSAPDEVKRRLLALWQRRGIGRDGQPADRDIGDVSFYFTLARLGLKDEVGKVEQRYFGPTFLAIWDDVTADSHPDLCGIDAGRLKNALRPPR